MEKKQKNMQKFIILARHGEVNISLKDLIYNRDEIMASNEIVHLSKEGQMQMKNLAKLIKKRQFKCTAIYSSPATRTKESVEALNKILKTRNVYIDKKLNDIYAPGPYLEGYKMKNLPEIESNPALLTKLIKKYKHESPRQVAKRMSQVFWRIAKKLKLGEAAILVSHGDPLAYLIHALLYPKKEIPTGKKKREGNWYCSKGNALIAEISQADHITNIYFLKKVRKDKIY